MSCTKRNQDTLPFPKPRSDAHDQRVLGYDLQLLLDRIGDRDAVVDACLPPQLVEELRRNDVKVVWVPAMLGDGASDDEIDRQLLRGSHEEREKEKVLLTRDVEFFKRIRSRAILVNFKPIGIRPQELQQLDMRKQIKLLRVATNSLFSAKNHR